MAKETVPDHRSTEELIVFYQKTGDDQALDLLVREYLSLVEYLARRFKRDGVDQQDLVQVGSIGLLKALKRYDIDGGNKFITYATPTIIGEIKHYYRDQKWAMKVPRRIKELSNRIHKETPTITQVLGRTPNTQDIAGYLGKTEEEILEALEIGQAYQIASLDSVVLKDGEGDSTLMNIVGGDDPGFERLAEYSELQYVMNELSAEEVHLLNLRFKEELTQQEISQQLGISQMQVSRLLRKLIGRLRKRFNEINQ